MKKSHKLSCLIFVCTTLFACNNQTNISSNSSTSVNSSENSSSSLVGENSSQNSSSINSSSSNSMEIFYKFLSEPNLQLNKENGLVTFSPIDGASFYRYYINEDEYKTTTNTQITLKDGESLVVMADSDDQYTIASSWSNPVSYFDASLHNNKIKVFFHNTNFDPIELNKGTIYTPSTPKKEGYIFDNWYVDPFYTELYTPSPLFENTILYANFIEDECINNTTYWIKANNLITSNIQKYYSSSSWKFIPLTQKTNSDKRTFEAIVNVVGTSSTSSGEFIILDGMDDNPGRTYWKNGSENFKITSDGTYRINFSLETEWMNGSNKVNAYFEKISATYLGRVPLNSNETKEYLKAPEVIIDKNNNLAYWEPIEDASQYAYQINNGEIKYTNDNNVPLYEDDYIVIKAITNNPDKQDSLWSRPYLYELKNKISHDFFYVYFFESDLPSKKVNNGDLVDRPNNPTKAKYTFENWYKDIGRKELFDFTKPITKNTIIYPKWIPLEDYKTTTYFTLQDASYNNLGNLTLNEDCITYNEYTIKYNFTTEANFYINRVKDNYKYGPYKISEAGEYNIYFSEEHIWDVNTEKARNVYYFQITKTIYFTDSLNWNNIHYYIWDKNNYYYSAWPGTKMTYVGLNQFNQDVYKAIIDVSKYPNIIFNGNNNQTENINIANCTSGDGFYTLNEKSGSNYKVGTYKYSD